jgi:hypothetical protein
LRVHGNVGYLFSRVDCFEVLVLDVDEKGHFGILKSGDSFLLLDNGLLYV